MMHSNNNILPPYNGSSLTKSTQEPFQIPVSIQIGDYNVWDFLGEVMSNRAATSSELSSFRLSPAYSLYLALRFFHSHNKPYSVQCFSRIESNFKKIAQECSSKDELIFWLANASEFNHLIERDTELKASRYGKVSVEIERIFRRLVAVLQSLIRPAARALLDIHLNDHDATGEVIHLLDTTMRQARVCGLNAALTIQLCGHLLHMVNAFVFNSLVAVNLPGIGETKVGIYVKKVVDGTPAAQDGRLETGDQLLSVNGHSLIGISQEDAARLMTQSGNEVHFDVRKNAASRNGLVNWLVPQTPTTSSTTQHFPPTHPPSYSNVSRNSSYDAPPGYNQQQRYTPQQNGGPLQQQGARNGALVTPIQTPSVSSSGAGTSNHLQQHYAHHNMHHNNVSSIDPLANRHIRSNSASDLQQQQHQDLNASFSQSSVSGSARSSVFDKLPSHYRHSTRPTVIQPARPGGAQSPSALRKTAPSPANGTNLYRPTSASNLFAPPRSNGGLVGYSSNAARESTQDIHRALNDLELNSPLARSTPNEEDSSYRIPPTVSNSNYAPLHSIRPASMYGYSNQMAPTPSSSSTSTTTTTVIPRVSSRPARPLSPPSSFSTNHNNYSTSSSPRVNVVASRSHNSLNNSHHSQEPAIVRPVDLNMPKTTPVGIKGAVPTAITQALQLHQNGTGAVRQIRPTSGLRERLQDADVRNLEKTNTALMSYEAVNDELDRLDTKGTTMTDEEQRRYRELLHVVAEQSRTRKMLAEVVRTTPQKDRERERDIPIQKESGRRVETMIDDVPHSSSSVENVSPVSPPESRKVQFIDEVVQYQTPTSTTTLFAAEVPVLDSPGIVGTNEIYRDPRQRRLNELQDRNKSHENGADGAKLGFRDKQRLFARQIGEDTAPRQRVNESSAQRLIETEVVNTQKP
uniref:PDZ domain-containing protein n=1 Tax=Caenorhabditis japonica TaxID=281687 RepID=A0A8R1E2E3_CAEJA